jgi:Tfp pilus assembly protein PilF
MFLLADLLVAADRGNEARQELSRLSADPAQRLSVERRLVALSMQEGDNAAAEARLEPLLGERGSTAMALFYLAQLAERRGDLARAIQNYRLLADSSLAVSARVAAARLMMEQGDQKSGLALIDEYAAQNPELAIDMASTRAQLLSQTGDVVGALKGLDEMIARYPDHPQLMYQRATVLETGNRSHDAIASFEQQLKLRPEDPQLTNALGFTLADHNQRLDRAEQLVRHALAISPDSPAIQDSMGWVLFRKGRTREALPILERAWSNSHDTEIAAHFGEALWKAGDEGRARYIWQQALNADPKQKRLLATVSRLTGETPATAAQGR